jgi:hypothetical protein
MALGQGQHHRFGDQPHRGQAGRRKARGMQHQAGIDRTLPQQCLLHIAGGLDQFQLHLGPGLPEGAHPVGQKVVAHGGNKGQPKVAHRPLGRRPSQCGQLLGALQHIAHGGQQGRTRSGERDMAPASVEQAHSQLAP